MEGGVSCPRVDASVSALTVPLVAKGEVGDWVGGWIETSLVSRVEASVSALTVPVIGSQGRGW